MITRVVSNGESGAKNAEYYACSLSKQTASGNSVHIAEGLNSLFDGIVNVARIKHGNKQTVDTLISEEALLLAEYLRKEKKEWLPRLPNLTLKQPSIAE